jgi:hypothetical protein
MAQNINISLPEELFERLKEVKNQINVSGVCQNALETEIEFCELKMKGSTMSTIERLTRQKEQFDEKYIEQGKAAGIKDAGEMDYEDLMEVVNANERIYKTDYYQNEMEDQLKEISNDDPAFNEDKYLEGWVEGVNEFWEEIKDEL